MSQGPSYEASHGVTSEHHRDPAGPTAGGSGAVGSRPGAAAGRIGPGVFSVSASNPRGLEAALAWQLDRLGSTAWRHWSLKFQRMAFGYSQEAGWHDAAEAAAWLRGHELLYAGVPPRGALVWYDDGGVTRVACALGDGRVVGAFADQGVALVDLAGLSERSWSAPLFPFAH